MKLRQHSRRKFIRNSATGLLVPTLMSSIVHGSVPLPLGFFKPASSSSSVTCDDATAISARDDWVTRVQGVGSDVTIAGTQLAVCAYIAGLIADGVWSKIVRHSIYCGDGLDALKAPLKNGGEGNAQDVLTNFVGGDYSQSVGLTGNTTTKSVLTGIGGTSALFGEDNLHLAVYCRTTDNVGYSIGAQNSGTGHLIALGPSKAGNAVFFSNNFNTGVIFVADVDGVGMYIGTRTADNFFAIYRNGTSIVSGTGTSGPLTGGAFRVHTCEPSIAGYWTARTLEMYSIGTGLTPTDVTNFTARYATLRTALGR